MNEAENTVCVFVVSASAALESDSIFVCIATRRVNLKMRHLPAQILWYFWHQTHSRFDFSINITLMSLPSECACTLTSIHTYKYNLNGLYNDT